MPGIYTNDPASNVQHQNQLSGM